jgi:hypothetical protein
MPRPRTEAAMYKKIVLRIPEDLLQEAQMLALQEDRSVNAQLVHLIREALSLHAKKGISHGKRSPRKL